MGIDGIDEIGRACRDSHELRRGFTQIDLLSNKVTRRQSDNVAGGW